MYMYVYAWQKLVNQPVVSDPRIDLSVPSRGNILLEALHHWWTSGDHLQWSLSQSLWSKTHCLAVGALAVH